MPAELVAAEKVALPREEVGAGQEVLGGRDDDLAIPWRHQIVQHPQQILTRRHYDLWPFRGALCNQQYFSQPDMNDEIGIVRTKGHCKGHRDYQNTPRVR